MSNNVDSNMLVLYPLMCNSNIIKSIFKRNIFLAVNINGAMHFYDAPLYVFHNHVLSVSNESSLVLRKGSLMNGNYSDSKGSKDIFPLTVKGAKRVIIDIGLYSLMV